MTGGLPESEVAATAEFLFSSSSYSTLDTDTQGTVGVECIDPREPDTQSPIPVVIQTPGGGAGVFIDRSIYAASKHNNPLPGATASLELEADRANLFFGAHYLCALIEARKTVVGEMARPSDFTQDLIDRYLKIYDQGNNITNGDRCDYDYGVKTVEEQIEALMANIHQDVGALTVAENVVNMKDHKAPHFYVVSHDPNRGLDREKMHREERLKAQAYFDNPAALLRRTIEVDDNTIGQRETAIRTLSLVGRTSATRTIIHEVSGRSLTHLDINVLGSHGKVEEIDSPKPNDKN